MVSGGAVLTDAKIKAAKPRSKSYLLTDGQQLYLKVTPAGGKLWRMNYAWLVDGEKRQRTLSFGSYPIVTLSEAREKRDAAKRLMAQGIEPSEHRKAGVEAESQARRNTFKACFEEWFSRSAGWPISKFYDWVESKGHRWTKREAQEWAAEITPAKNLRFGPKHAIDIISRFESDILPVLGAKPVRDIKATHVLEALQTVEGRGAIETAHRLRQHISLVLQSAVNRGYCAGDVSAGLLQELTPKPEVQPQPSIVDGLMDQSQRIATVQKLIADCEANPAQCTATLIWETSFAGI